MTHFFAISIDHGLLKYTCLISIILQRTKALNQHIIVMKNQRLISDNK